MPDEHCLKIRLQREGSQEYYTPDGVSCAWVISVIHKLRMVRTVAITYDLMRAGF